MDWIGITCWAVMGLAAVLALWALLWDRPRGRLRCRRCAYDMSGGGLLCPECGREHKSERVLKRVRRKWKTACIGVVLLSVTMLVRVQHFSIYNEGWSGVLPTYVVAMMADVDGERSFHFNALTWFDRKMDKRLGKHNASRVSLRLWAGKIADNLAADYSDVAEVRVYDISSVSKEFMLRLGTRWTDLESRSNFDIEWISAHDAEGVVDIIIKRFWDDDTAITEVPFVVDQLVGDQLVLAVPLAEHQMFEHMLNQIMERYWTPRCPQNWELGQHASFVRYDISWMMMDQNTFSPMLFYQLLGHIEVDILPIPLDPGYGDVAAYMPLFGSVVVWAEPRYHQEVMQYLAESEAEYETGKSAQKTDPQ